MKRPLLIVILALSLPGTGALCADEPRLHPLSNGFNNRDLTISPDGSMLLTTVMAPANQFSAILIAERTPDGWGATRIAPFSGEWRDIEPMFAPDGLRLFFASNRPKPGREGDDWDIWFVDRLPDDAWGEPQNVGSPVNSPANEFYPSVSRAGHLYFTAERKGGEGSEDIFRGVFDKASGKWSQVESVGSGVNSEGFEFNAFVDPDEHYIIFTAQGREGELGRGDLYISHDFGPAVRLAAPVNSPRLDYCPFVRDGVLFFSSNRFGDNEFHDMTTLDAVLNGPGNGLGDIYQVPFSTVPFSTVPINDRAQSGSP